MDNIETLENPSMAQPSSAMASDAMEHGLAVVSIAKNYDKRSNLILHRRCVLCASR